jgi:glyoxylase-like metal-dependent hydrolase (beta-lactamase superfamily II)
MVSGEIVFVEGANEARFPDSNCLYVDDEILTVIDPATRPETFERLERERGVRLVVNSHYHVDHVRYNRLFPNAEFLAHEADAPAIRSLDDNARIVGIADEPWAEIWKNVMRQTWGWVDTEVSRTVRGGEELNTGANTLRFVHTPGHTPGHMCVEFVEKRVVYLGDIDLTRFGPWYGNRVSDIDDFLRSIELLKGMTAETWYTAHGKGIIHGDIRDRLDAYESVIFDRDRRLLEYLEEAGPRTLTEIIDRAIIFGRRWDPPEMFEFFEGTMVGKHLDRLERRGSLRLAGDRWSRT